MQFTDDNINHDRNILKDVSTPILVSSDYLLNFIQLPDHDNVNKQFSPGFCASPLHKRKKLITHTTISNNVAHGKKKFDFVGNEFHVF